MIVLLSPSKTQNFRAPAVAARSTQPQFLNEAAELMERLREKSPKELQELMKLSDVLAQATGERFQEWRHDHSEHQSGSVAQAVYAYTGEVFRGLNAGEFSSGDIAYAQEHLCILSGLYGVLRPLDLIRPYRLEMATSLATENAGSLYEFWGDKPTTALRNALSPATGRKTHQTQDIVNLASQEYVRVIQPAGLPGRIVTPQFKERHKGEYRIVAMYAKNARGRMAHWIIKNRIDDPKELMDFHEDGYLLHTDFSTPDKPVFVRERTP
ncbi:MAG: peroxide stress protein YaaA [Spirochaetaceae bacterium]|nr:MAG: peroxide stress protein YaaA [Spirochaetaceae bacterium]